MNEELRAPRPPAPAARRPAPAWRWWLLPLGWMALIFTLSAQPDFAFIPDSWQSEALSLAAHALEYGALAGLLWLAASKTPASARQPSAWAFVLTLLYALSDELHQSFVPGRVPDGRDVLMDVAAAGAVLWLVRRRRQRRPDSA